MNSRKFAEGQGGKVKETFLNHLAQDEIIFSAKPKYLSAIKKLLTYCWPSVTVIFLTVSPDINSHIINQLHEILNP
jgi:hypothetical protein